MKHHHPRLIDPYVIWFASIQGIAPEKKIKLHKVVESVQSIYQLSEEELLQLNSFFDHPLTEIEMTCLREAQTQTQDDIIHMIDALDTHKIRFVPWNSPKYPQKLLKIASPPYALFYKGNLPQEDQASAAIIGARSCTPYGETQALEFSESLAANDVQVISGLAYGIDGFGHRGALHGKGTTFAVLGCGVDTCYPRSNIGLYSNILEAKGGILSEYPPGTPPLSYHFPQRNRIISALSDVVLVIEAKEKSGSLITVDVALEQGKEVFALPGPIHSKLSQGCNQLIRQGAGILLSTEQLFEDMGVVHELWECYTQKHKKKKRKTQKDSINSSDLGTEATILSHIYDSPVSTEQLFEKCNIPIQELLSKLVTLSIKGFIREHGRGSYVRIMY